jgi:hypothetical protein
VLVGLSFLFYVPCCCFCCLLVFNEVEVGANIHTNFDELHSVDELRHDNRAHGPKPVAAVVLHPSSHILEADDFLPIERPS